MNLQGIVKLYIPGNVNLASVHGNNLRGVYGFTYHCAAKTLPSQLPPTNRRREPVSRLVRHVHFSAIKRLTHLLTWFSKTRRMQ